MLRYTTIGAKIIAFLSIFLAGAALYLPFLEGFALTPAIAFIHRFSLTLNIGADTKTLQPIVFIVPILLIKSVLEFHKRYSIQTLLKSNLAKIIGMLVVTDLVSIATSTARGASISGFIVHGMNLALFITASIWLKIVSDLLTKPALQKVGITLVKTFAIALVGFSVVNAVVSVTQFVDCSGSTQCHVWKTIDEAFPNKLLAVGHQKFAYKPVVIRAPGFFGDVNFNGMVSLLIAVIAAVLYLFFELLTKEKGYQPVKEKRFLLIPLLSGMVSFMLTLSRSAMLGSGVLFIVLMGLAVLPLIKKFGISIAARRQILTLSIGSLIAVIALFLVGLLVPLSYNNRKSSLSGEILIYAKQMFDPKEDSAAGHANLFSDAVKIGNQRPLVGMGLGTFSTEYARVIDNTNTTANPHSTYGMLYAEQGIVGLLGYIAVMIILWATSVKALARFTRSTTATFAAEKRPGREQFMIAAGNLFLILISFGIPYFTIATVTYYGFFLPMTWWWGNGEVAS